MDTILYTFPRCFIPYLLTFKHVNSKKFRVHHEALFGARIFLIFLKIACKMHVNAY